jgi:mono/diheme cytochrome c family protein
MRAELLAALAVIAATATLTQLPSPRSALPELSAGPQKDRSIQQIVTLDDLVGTLSISPNLVGQNRYTVLLRDAAGGPPHDSIRAVRLRFRYADPAVGPVTVAATPQGEDRYLLEGAYFGLAGDWTVDLEVRREQRDDVVGSVATQVEQPFLNTLPFATSSAGALALPISQFDWNGVGAIWAAVAAGMLIAYRRPIGRRFSAKAADATVVGGALFMTVTVVLAFSVHVDPGRTLENPTPRTPESVARGQPLFATNCVQCHGDMGGGDGPLAASLPAPPANFRVHVPYHPDGVLFTWISNGIRGTGMPAFRTTLSEEQRWDLVNFLRATFDEPLRSNDAPLPSDPPAP